MRLFSWPHGYETSVTGKGRLGHARVLLMTHGVLKMGSEEWFEQGCLRPVHVLPAHPSLYSFF